MHDSVCFRLHQSDLSTGIRGLYEKMLKEYLSGHRIIHYQEVKDIFSVLDRSFMVDDRKKSFEPGKPGAMDLSPVRP